MPFGIFLAGQPGDQPNAAFRDHHRNESVQFTYKKSYKSTFQLNVSTDTV